MANLHTVFSGNRKHVVNITGVFNSSDETNVVVVDKSSLIGLNGKAPSRLKVLEMTWSVGIGYDYILLEWDHTTDDPIEYLQGQGYMDYTPFGGKHDNDPDASPSNGTGDIILTTSGGAAGDTYSILLAVQLKD